MSDKLQEEFHGVLQDQFDTGHYPLQPRAIIHFDHPQGHGHEILESGLGFIKGSTRRGHQLEGYPLELIHVQGRMKDSMSSGMRSKEILELEGDLHGSSFPWTSYLLQKKIEPDQALLIYDVNRSRVTNDLNQLAQIAGKPGILIIDEPLALETQGYFSIFSPPGLLLCSSLGLFQTRPGTRTLKHFVKDSHQIRTLAPNELGRATRILGPRINGLDLTNLLDINPQGQFLLEVDGEFCGTFLTLNILDPGSISGSTLNTVPEFHQPRDGKYLFLLQLALVKKFQHIGLEEKVLRFLKDLAEAHHGFQGLTLVTSTQEEVKFHQGLGARREKSISDFWGDGKPGTLLNYKLYEGHKVMVPASPPPPLQEKDPIPIAIIGLACRFPGADNPSTFWDLLVSKTDPITQVPPTRFDSTSISNPVGGFISSVDGFDPEFFRISRRAASWIDPTHRLLLETHWEACEVAGIPPSNLSGSRTGVFVGLSSHDYEGLVMGSPDHESEPFQALIGSSAGFAAGRISHFFNLSSGTLAVDTASSSSLTAVHLAVNSLRSSESDLAFASGAHLLLSGGTSQAYSVAGMLSKETKGRCRSFSGGNGYVRGEGVGTVLLKPLTSALSDGNNIFGVIRGSAIGAGSGEDGPWVPFAKAHQEVYLAALANGGLQPGSIQYLEGHGPGTRFDLTELESIRSVYGSGEGRSSPLLLGSVKSNVGHLEGAAGICSLIKVLLSLNHGFIPANLHTSDSVLDLGESIQLMKEGVDWPKSEPNQPRRAGISNFGLNGSIAHLILEEAPALAYPMQISGSSPPQLITFSARTQKSLNDLIRSTGQLLGQNPGISIDQVAWTRNLGREHFPQFRTAFVVTSTPELLDKIKSDDYKVVQGPEPELPQGLAFIFTGQGSQFPGMGRALY